MYIKKIEVNFCKKMIKQFITQKNQLFTYTHIQHYCIDTCMMYVEIIIDRNLDYVQRNE